MGYMVYIWFVLWFCFAGIGVLPKFMVGGGGNVVSDANTVVLVTSYSIALDVVVCFLYPGVRRFNPGPL